MPWYQRQPTLDEILSDCITQAVMRADGVDPTRLAVTLREVAQNSGAVARARRGTGRWLRICITSLVMWPLMACPVSADDDDAINLSEDAVIDRSLTDGHTADPPTRDKA